MTTFWDIWKYNKFTNATQSNSFNPHGQAVPLDSLRLFSISFLNNKRSVKWLLQSTRCSVWNPRWSSSSTLRCDMQHLNATVFSRTLLSKTMFMNRASRVRLKEMRMNLPLNKPQTVKQMQRKLLRGCESSLYAWRAETQPMGKVQKITTIYKINVTKWSSIGSVDVSEACKNMNVKSWLWLLDEVSVWTVCWIIKTEEKMSDVYNHWS